LLLLEVFEIDVLEILRQLALYATINRPENNNTARINQNRIVNSGISII
jgi:hypothetical protein